MAACLLSITPGTALTVASARPALADAATAAAAVPTGGGAAPPSAAPASDPAASPVTGPATAPLQFSPGPFADLMPGYWASPAIQDLAQAGLALVPAPNTFDPYGAETRGAWTEQVVLALLPSPPAAPPGSPFLDVAASDPAAPEIAAAAQRGWVVFPTPYGFVEDAPITREEAFALLGTALLGKGTAADPGAAALPFADAASISPWARGPILALYEAGYISGVGGGDISPQAPLQRADAAALLDAVLRHLITAGGHRYRVVSVLQMRATAYGAGEGVGGTTATGTPCRLGEAAADPAALPYGTTLFVTGYNGYGYLPAGGLVERIEDTGMLGPDDIDLYMPASSVEPYLLFGVQTVTAYVLDPDPVA